MRFGPLTCCAIVVFLGCSNPAPRKDHGASAAPTAPRTTSTDVTVAPTMAPAGKVVWLNAAVRYVLVSFPPGQVPRPETRLSVYRNGLKVGELKVSKERLDQN